MSRADLFVISAPSGTGKTTLVKRLLAEVPGLDFSVSFTTRPMRPGEKEGTDYHFVDESRFEKMIQRGEFLEWAEVHGRRYGTSTKLVDASLSGGKDVLLDIDTQGAASVRRARPEAVLAFIMPPDFETLKRRLLGREGKGSRGGTGTADVGRRLRDATDEMERYAQYDYLVINDDLEEALRDLKAIVFSHRSKGRRRREACARIVEGFRASSTK